MKRLNGLSVLLVSLVIVSASIATAQSFRTTPGIESQFRQAITAVESEQYIRATQLLTRLVGLPEHVHSRRAQELLGNVREANGQFAHAVAGYEIYLEKYPEGPGATRVGARLSSILGGATPLPRQPDITAIIEDRSQTAQPSRPRRSICSSVRSAPLPCHSSEKQLAGPCHTRGVTALKARGSPRRCDGVRCRAARARN